MSNNQNGDPILTGEALVNGGEAIATESTAKETPQKAIKSNKKEKAPKAEKPKKKKKPWTKKRIITWAVITVLVLALAYSCVAAPVIAANAARTQVPMALGTTVLAPREISTSISATGIVESANKNYVYPAMAGYTVMEVPVEVGDVVQEGDTLCLLDDGAVKDQIDTQKLNLTQSEKAANQQVKTVKDSYEAAKAAVRNGTDASIIAAQGQVTSAYNNYISAVDSYRKYQDGQSDLSAAVTRAKQLRDAAELNLNAARARQLALVGTASATDVEKEKAALEVQIAERDFNAAQTAYQSAQSAQNEGSQGSSLSRAVDTAYNAYINSLRSLDSTINAVETQLNASKNQLSSAAITAETAKLSKELTLKQLNESLGDTVVTAPASGTITAVYATVGGPGTGLLFVIEDVNDLIVKTTVKAFDIGTVSPGLPVAIKSDATGEAVYEGSLTFIAPATQKTAMGDTNPANEVFDAEVAVSSKNTDLRIGMSARLNYLVEKQENVLAVPYDAIYTNAAGQSCVLAAVENGKGKYVLTEIAVTLGIESDLDVAISGEGIVEGLRIINEPEGRQPGQVITLV